MIREQKRVAQPSIDAREAARWYESLYLAQDRSSLSSFSKLVYELHTSLACSGQVIQPFTISISLNKNASRRYYGMW